MGFEKTPEEAERLLLESMSDDFSKIAILGADIAYRFKRELLNASVTDTPTNRMALAAAIYEAHALDMTYAAKLSELVPDGSAWDLAKMLRAIFFDLYKSRLETEGKNTPADTARITKEWE